MRSVRSYMCINMCVCVKSVQCLSKFVYVRGYRLKPVVPSLVHSPGVEITFAPGLEELQGLEI